MFRPKLSRMSGSLAVSAIPSGGLRLHADERWWSCCGGWRLLTRWVAYRNHETLNQTRAALLSLSSRLDVIDEDELAYVALPGVANDFETWEVHVLPRTGVRVAIGNR